MSISYENFKFVAALVCERSAILLADGKEYLVESRLAPIARSQGQSVDAYIAQRRNSINSHDAEVIVEALTTNETSWFRDAQPFTALTGHIVPALRAQNTVLPSIKIWSAACSTGQEPYSIVMALRQLFAASDEFPKPNIDVLATDLSNGVLQRAKSGRYTQLEVNRGLPAQHLVQYFSRMGTEWELNPEIRRSVRFKKHNLLDEPPFGGPFDVVFMRNVLIYFDVPTKRAVLARVSKVLRPGGFLVLGSAETTVGIDDTWRRIQVGRSSIYQRAES